MLSEIESLLTILVVIVGIHVGLQAYICGTEKMTCKSLLKTSIMAMLVMLVSSFVTDVASYKNKGALSISKMALVAILVALFTDSRLTQTHSPMRK